MVRTFVVAPAQMHAQLLGRDVGERVVERGDVHAGTLAEFGEVEVGVLDVPAHGEVGTVDLQDEAGLGDGLVFVAHRVGDGEQIGLVVLVVLVAEEQRDHARRRRAHERVGAAGGRERALERRDVVTRGRGIAHRDRRVAGGGLAARAPGIAEHALGEVREIDEVLIDEGVAGAAEAREPIFHIGGVARLRHFAVVDVVDAGVGLLLHHLRHRFAHARVERGAIDRHALFLGVHHADEVVRPRQAAGVGGQEALGAASHDPLAGQSYRPQYEAVMPREGGASRLREYDGGSVVLDRPPSRAMTTEVQAAPGGESGLSLAGAGLGPPLATPTSAGRSIRSPIM